MNLKEFVADTLKQIIDGVTEAQEYGRQKDARVNPLHLPVRDQNGGVHSVIFRADVAHPVEFDVAVTAAEERQAKGGVGVIIAGWTLGASGQSKAGNEHVSRIKFTIPVVLPTSKE
jgi:hypothetical protein